MKKIKVSHWFLSNFFSPEKFCFVYRIKSYWEFQNFHCSKYVSVLGCLGCGVCYSKLNCRLFKFRNCEMCFSHTFMCSCTYNTCPHNQCLIVGHLLDFCFGARHSVSMRCTHIFKECHGNLSELVPTRKMGCRLGVTMLQPDWLGKLGSICGLFLLELATRWRE